MPTPAKSAEENTGGPAIAVLLDERNSSNRAALSRVLSSATFAKAPRLCAMLLHIAEHTLSGELTELTEQQIGIQVFGRRPGYNSAEDTIVRGTARLLRQRLDLFYSQEGRTDPVRLSVPKGSYVASFDQAADIRSERTAEPGSSVSSAVERNSRWPFTAKIVVAALTTLLAVAVGYLWFRQAHDYETEQKTPRAIWEALFTPGRKTLIVPGDASLDAYIAWEQRPVPLADYTNQGYQREVGSSKPPNGNDVPIATRSVTPMADLRLVSELVRVPHWLNKPEMEPWIDIKYARDVVVADTHDNNLILIGTETFNPWVSLYRANLDFHAQWDYKTDIYSVINGAQKQGEKPRYDYLRDVHTPSNRAITHIALIDNSQGQGKVLIIEGTSMGTTYAAVTFFEHENLWRPVVEAATDRKGTLHSFEVLLASDFVRGGVSNTQRVALHVH